MLAKRDDTDGRTGGENGWIYGLFKQEVVLCGKLLQFSFFPFHTFLPFLPRLGCVNLFFGIELSDSVLVGSHAISLFIYLSFCFAFFLTFLHLRRRRSCRK